MPYRAVLMLLVSSWCVACSPQNKADEAITASAQPPSESSERADVAATKEEESAPGGARGVSFTPEAARPLDAQSIEGLPVWAKGPVAMVDGVAISADAFNREVALARERSELTARGSLRPQATNIIEEMIDDHLFDRAIEAERIQPPTFVVAAAFDASLARFDTIAQYEDFLALQGFDKAGHRDEVARAIAMEMLLEKRGLFAVAEDELRAAYRANPAKYKEAEQVSARHIIFRTNKNMDEEELSAVREKADRVYRLASREGADFAALAREHSEGPTASRGGQLGYFPRGRMVQPFEDAAFDLRVGDVSAPVQTRFGWHLIKVEGHKQTRVKSFEEVREALESELVSMREREARATFLTSERAVSEITLLEDNLEFVSGSE